MQAVILVGGEGTRLRPLTSRQPKPVITLVDRPFLVYMLEWLRGHGVRDVILSCGFEPTKVREALGDGTQLGLKLRYVVEPEPRGTAGALKYADEQVGGLDDRFLMLNGDVLTDVDVTAQIAQHEETGAVGTLGLVPVEDPSAYGLVLCNGHKAVTGFLEKPAPSQLDGIDRYYISAGVYVLEHSVLDLIPSGQNVSIERAIWPALVGHGLHGSHAEGAYWMDIGTPERYLQGTFDILEGNVRTGVTELLGASYSAIADDVVADGRVVPPAVVGAGSKIGAGAHVGSLVVLGRGVTIGPGARVERSVVLDGVTVGANAVVSDCIVAPGATIGDGAVLRGGAVIGDDVRIGAGNVLASGIRVFPDTTLPPGAIKF
ncbi:MAG TPA: NDP-sugar synthase [Baekduia sp.]|uniref:NDP-sugar synthase n=1 Tax=Baekduia sp. TaxID=2600305 RepID=UPI002D7A2DDA|nr:NDP-sugar synthase [Baekduia sp.]HET6506715.1 NDP-sugar synthase [Baekduia sp.]